MEAVKEAVVTEAARGEVAMAAVEVADLLQQCALQQRLLAHRAVAARLPPRRRPLRDALAVEEVAARQHAADLVVGVAAQTDRARRRLTLAALGQARRGRLLQMRRVVLQWLVPS